MPQGDFARRRLPCSCRSSGVQFATVVRVWGIKGVGDTKKRRPLRINDLRFYCVQDEDTRLKCGFKVC